MDILCESHVIQTILFLEEVGDCTKSQLYGSVSRTSSMPRRLDAMEAAGLITQTSYNGSNMQTIALTRLGHEVACRLRDIESMMSAAD